jgi:hypothetical protein
MPEATSNHTIAPTRRHFLSQSAGVARLGRNCRGAPRTAPLAASAAPAVPWGPLRGYRKLRAARECWADEQLTALLASMEAPLIFPRKNGQG